MRSESPYHIGCSRLCQWRIEKTGGRRVGSGLVGKKERSAARRWSRLSPARFFDHPHWPRAWNRLHTTRTAPRFVRWTKLSPVLRGSYLDGWPNMNPPCCNNLFFFSFPFKGGIKDCRTPSLVWCRFFYSSTYSSFCYVRIHADSRVFIFSIV